MDSHQPGADLTDTSVESEDPVASTSRRWNSQPYFIWIAQQIEVEARFISTMASRSGCPSLTANASQPFTSPFARNPAAFQEMLYSWVQ